MSLRITFLNQKGGVGKSTAAGLVAAVLKEAGFRVAADDRDPQKTLAFWAREVGGIPLVDEVDSPDVVVTDTPGRLDLNQESVVSGFRSLVGESDRVVLVSEKTLFSLHASAPMLRIVLGHRRPETRVCVLFNKVRSATVIGRQSDGELAQRLGIPATSTHLPLAAAYERFETEGLAAVRGRPLELAKALALELVS